MQTEIPKAPSLYRAEWFGRLSWMDLQRAQGEPEDFPGRAAAAARRQAADGPHRQGRRSLLIGGYYEEMKGNIKAWL